MEPCLEDMDSLLEISDFVEKIAECDKVAYCYFFSIDKVSEAFYCFRFIFIHDELIFCFGAD